MRQHGAKITKYRTGYEYSRYSNSLSISIMAKKPVRSNRKRFAISDYLNLFNILIDQGGFVGENKLRIQQSKRVEKLEIAQKRHQCMMTTLTAILAAVGIATAYIMWLDLYIEHHFAKIFGF